MAHGIAGMVTEIKYGRSDRKHCSKHRANAALKLTVRRYHRAVRKLNRKLIEEGISG
jgi:hypothetical protein